MSTQPLPPEFKDHPLIKQVTDDIAASRAQLQTQRMLDEMEAKRARLSHLNEIHDQYTSALEDYEQLRLQLHEALGRLWAAVEAHSALTSQPPNGFPEVIFHKIDVPTLRPPSGPWSNVNGVFTTTRAAVEGWMATHGKTWPLQN